MLDRAITRDLDWGVELPVDDLGPGKRIYVWYDAVIGYLSASQEWAQRQGNDERWRHWWYNDDSRHVYFIGKDNIPFHCLFWPAQLMGYDPEIHLPDDVPANQYITFKGGKASASRGVGLTIQEVSISSRPTDSGTPSPPASRAGGHRHLDRGDRPPDQRRARGDVGQPRQPCAVDGQQELW